MTKIYLMRHGETLFNVLHLNEGQSDSPLTEKGTQQALLAKKWFERRDIHFDAVYSSPLARAAETARLMSGCSQIHFLDELKEIYLGTYEGSPAYLTPKYPYGDFFAHFGGESLEEVTSRMITGMRMIMQKEGNKSVLVISHMIAIRRFLTAIGYFTETEYAHLGGCSGAALLYTNQGCSVVQLIQAEEKAAGDE